MKPLRIVVGDRKHGQQFFTIERPCDEPGMVTILAIGECREDQDVEVVLADFIRNHPNVQDDPHAGLFDAEA